MTVQSIPRFDGAEAWARLSPEQQAEIGALALELVIAAKTAASTDGLDELHVRHRAAQAAGDILIDALDEVVTRLIPHMVDFGDLPIPVAVGDICRRCGCTENDACDDGCAWHAPGLCTACVPGAAEGFACIGGRA